MGTLLCTDFTMLSIHEIPPKLQETFGKMCFYGTITLVLRT